MADDPPNRIRELRDMKPWSVRELASAAGMDPTKLNRLERGTQPLDYPSMKKIARALECKVSELLLDEDVELRADEKSQQILAELKAIPRDALPDFIGATRQLLSAARSIAVQRSSAALGGDVRQIGQLADLWNRWDDSQRDKAIQVLRLTDRP